MKFLLPWVIAVAFTATLWQAPAAQSKKATSSAKKSSTKKSAAKTSKKSKKGVSRGVSWRNRQTVPAPERYKEIQDALVAKGFLKPEDANGVWGPTSVDALRQFQASQSIDATGKLNSLSLIALGLGPKYETTPPKLNQ